jgi:hypothetical protein
MLDDGEERDDEVAAAICPMPDCGALTVTCLSADRTGGDDAEACEFTCWRCGAEFTVPQDEFVLQSVPKGSLLARHHVA